MIYLAYFDYLGFKDFIENNKSDYQRKVIESNFVFIENALGKGKFKKIQEGYTSDLSSVKIQCLNFSDTVLFWTKDDDPSSFKELLEVSFIFNWSCMFYTFPIRGVIIRGDIFGYSYKYENEVGGTYSVNSLFGKGLVSAYLKSGEANWAGTVIDHSVIAFLNENGINVPEFLNPYAMEYSVPYKNPTPPLDLDWVLRLVKAGSEISEEAFINRKRDIVRIFSSHNKHTDSEDVQVKIKNTIAFLEAHR